MQMGNEKSTVMISIGLSEYLILTMVKLQIMHYYLISFSTNLICPHFKFPVYSKVFLKVIFKKYIISYSKIIYFYFILIYST